MADDPITPGTFIDSLGLSDYFQKRITDLETHVHDCEVVSGPPLNPANGAGKPLLFNYALEDVRASLRAVSKWHSEIMQVGDSAAETQRPDPEGDDLAARVQMKVRERYG